MKYVKKVENDNGFRKQMVMLRSYKLSLFLKEASDLLETSATRLALTVCRKRKFILSSSRTALTLGAVLLKTSLIFSPQ